MSSWSQLPSCGRLICAERPPHTLAIPTIALYLEELPEEQPKSLPISPSDSKEPYSNIYPSRLANPACFQIPELSGDVYFSFSHQYTAMLPKFDRDGDA